MKKRGEQTKKKGFHFVPFLRFMCHHAVEDGKQNKREGEEGKLKQNGLMHQLNCG